MTWIDNNGEIRPQSWEEYLAMKRQPSEVCDCLICKRIRQRESTFKLRRARYNTERVERGCTPRSDPLPRMRIRLFRADPRCFWCGTEVVLDGHKKSNLATVDHLYSRWHPERKTRHTKGDRVLHVLACSACNTERGAAENQGIQFIPKLPERREFARLADATLAQQATRATKRQPLPPSPAPLSGVTVRPMRVIQTLKEAVKFARENPAR